MASGKKRKQTLDLLTDWELTALNVLISLHPEREIDVNAIKVNMLALVEALDGGELDFFLGEPGFMQKTEALLLAVLHGERIEVADPNIFAAQKEIFAAAQVIYNQAVARGLWEIHPEIHKAIG